MTRRRPPRDFAKLPRAAQLSWIDRQPPGWMFEVLLREYVNPFRVHFALFRITP